MSSLFIKNGRVIDPVNNIDSVANVLVVDGVIAEVSDKLSADADKVIDAEGCWVMPGFIDLHVHLREPIHRHFLELPVMRLSSRMVIQR